MAVKVTIPSASTRSPTVVTTNNTRSPTVVTPNSRTTTATKLEGLADVDLTGAQDGYTFTFNADTGKWQAAPVSELAIDSTSITSLDGGTF